MKQLKFYDLKKRKSFTTVNYKFVFKNVKGKRRKFAVAKSSSGTECWRIV